MSGKPNKGPPKDVEKKPKLSKAERRALQEAQRAIKAAGGGKGGGGGTAVGPGGKNTTVPGTGDAVATTSPVGLSNDVQEFSHLPPYREKSPADCGLTLSAGAPSGPSPALHPSVLALGLQYADGSVRGANARCKAMMGVFKDVIRDFEPSPGKILSQDLDHTIKSAFQHWTTKCRTHSVSMGSAFSFLKSLVAGLSRDITEKEAKEELTEQIDFYLHERLDFAGKVIASHAGKKIRNGDVILTYGRSSAVETLLRRARDDGKNFRVVVVDGRPLLEGKVFIRALAGHGIPCTYILLSGLSYVMREVSIVFLGAAALMSNGSVLGRAGTATVALAARASNVPVLFGCETYKISNRIQLESITGNELGNPDDVKDTGAGTSALDDWKDAPNLKLLNLLYDLTPSEFVSGIVTEMGILPPSSVAVLIREMNPQDQ